MQPRQTVEHRLGRITRYSSIVSRHLAKEHNASCGRVADLGPRNPSAGPVTRQALGALGGMGCTQVPCCSRN